MKCRDCGERTYVVVSQRLPDGNKRLRRCNNCKVSAYTGEVWLTTLPPKANKSVYTQREVEELNRSKVNARRKNEDRRKENED
jgi:hypothetical protein